MPKAKQVVVLRTGNTIVIDSDSQLIEELLIPHISFSEKVFLRGKEKYFAEKNGESAVYDQVWDCYTKDHRGRIAVSFGFLETITAVLADAGISVKVKQLGEVPSAEIYRPRWERLSEEKYRYKQKRVLEIFAEHENGRIDCPPGYGKSKLIVDACTLFPKARFAVVTRNVPVMLERLYPALCQSLPSVGVVGGKKRIKGRRVMCYTLASLHHAEGDEDFVLVDECHQAASDDAAYKMGIFEHARLFGLSGSHDMRLDNKDMRCEAMFGPIRLKVKYQKAVDHGMVVPITVVWNDVIMDIDPCAGYDSVDRKRHGVWTNDYRNEIIARDAHKYDEDVQVLITVETIEHALHLKKLLPEFELVYNGDSVAPRDWRYYRDAGLLPENFRHITDVRRSRMARRFTSGKLKKVIATTVWNVGVDFKHLQVLIRADAGGSPINDVQIPGRTSRINDGKLVGIVHDYLDQFSTGFEMKAARRSTSYARNEWTQLRPERNRKSMLRQLMEWGSVDEA